MEPDASAGRRRQSKLGEGEDGLLNPTEGRTAEYSPALRARTLHEIVPSDCRARTPGPPIFAPLEFGEEEVRDQA